MRKFAADHVPGQHGYRLNPSVFYLKFVKRDGLISKGSIITPLDHFDKLRKDPACRGPKKGLRVSYKSLSGRYLRQSRRGINQFTVARSHTLLADLKVPAPCLVQGKNGHREDLYFGQISLRRPTTTLQSLIKVQRLEEIRPLHGLPASLVN